MNTNREINYESLSYTKLETDFKEGQMIHNFNGRDYRIMEKLSEKNLLLMDDRTGCFVVANGTRLYARHPSGTEAAKENSQTGVEWEHGVYLSSRPSAIDFRYLKQEYGTEKTIEDIYEYRQMLRDRFRMYERLGRDNLAGDALKEAVKYIAYEEFGTQKFEEFNERLQAGHYDHGFTQLQEEKKEKSR